MHTASPDIEESHSEGFQRPRSRDSDIVANLKVGGHPDLLPKGHYSSNLILKGDERIELKSSIQKGGWQGHNPEDCWLIVFRYIVGKQDDDRVVPLTFVEILCAKLTKKDWSFSGRKGASRRTPTASITTSGVEKLRSNFVYRLPGFGKVLVTVFPFAGKDASCGIAFTAMR